MKRGTPGRLCNRQMVVLRIAALLPPSLADKTGIRDRSLWDTDTLEGEHPYEACGTPVRSNGNTPNDRIGTPVRLKWNTPYDATGTPRTIEAERLSACYPGDRCAQSEYPSREKRLRTRPDPCAMQTLFGKGTRLQAHGSRQCKFAPRHPSQRSGHDSGGGTRMRLTRCSRLSCGTVAP